MAISEKRVNRESRGLLDLFRAKVGGQGPKEFSTNVQPTVDVTGFLGSGILVTRTASLTAASGAIEIDVPSDEVWLLYCLSVGVHQITSSQVGYSGHLYLKDIPNGTGGAAIDAKVAWWGYTPSLSGPVAQNQLAEAQFVPGHTLLLPPDSGVGSVINAAPVSVVQNLSVLYSVLKV